jgi:hypothetical protein
VSIEKDGVGRRRTDMAEAGVISKRETAKAASGVRRERMWVALLNIRR